MVSQKENEAAKAAGNKKTKNMVSNHSMCSCQDTEPDKIAIRSRRVGGIPETAAGSESSKKGLQSKDTISGGHNEGVPPVPIPNTEVKPFSAEST